MFYGFITHSILHVTVLQIYRISYIVQAAQMQEVVLKEEQKFHVIILYQLSTECTEKGQYCDVLSSRLSE